MSEEKGDDKERVCSSVGRTVVVGMGFLSDAFDLFVINMVLVLLKILYPPQTTSEVSLVASMALIGAVAGQLIFGGLADYFGRRIIFLTTCLLLICGSLTSAMTVNTSGFSVYYQLAICRFFLGFGIGGEYPLSATISRENSQPGKTGAAMAAVFSMQGVGSVLASAVVFFCLLCGAEYEFTWRFSLAVSVVPVIGTFYFRWKMEDNHKFQNIKKNRTSHLENLRITVKHYYWQIIGTAGCWFIFDITFYGNGLFSSEVTSLMGLGTSPEKQALNSFLVALIALPGYFLSVFFIQKIGRKVLQAAGFLMIGLLYFYLAVFFEELKEFKVIFLLLYGLTFLFSNFGPNATTYVIPGEYFPTEARATAVGFSAASGKVGGAIATYMFPLLLKKFGGDDIATARLLYLCGSVAVLGLIWTLIFVPYYTDQSLADKEEEDAILFQQLLPGDEGKRMSKG